MSLKMEQMKVYPYASVVVFPWTLNWTPSFMYLNLIPVCSFRKVHRNVNWTVYNLFKWATSTSHNQNVPTCSLPLIIVVPIRDVNLPTLPLVSLFRLFSDYLLLLVLLSHLLKKRKRKKKAYPYASLVETLIYTIVLERF